MIGLGCSAKSCTFLKMGVDGTNGKRVFHWSHDSYFPVFAKVYCTKERQTEVCLLRIKVFYDVKKLNT